MSIVGIIATYVFYKMMNWQLAFCIFYFTLMEIIQAIGYLVIDDCNNIINKFMSYLNYIHISFQPAVFVFFYYSLMNFFKLPNITQSAFKVINGIALICGLFFLSRLFPISKYNLQSNCALCGKKPCVKSGKHHLKIEMPLRKEPEYLTPSIFVHFLFFFLPPLFMGKCAIIIDLFIFIGLLMINSFSNSTPEEISTTWCLFSIAQIISSIAIAYVFYKTNGNRKSLF